MRFASIVLFLACAWWPLLGATQDTAEIEKIADLMVRLCVGGGRTEASGTASGGANSSLCSLDVKGNLKGEFKIRKSNVEGLVNGLDNALIRVRADQADKVRACLQPIQKKLLDYLLPFDVPPGNCSPRTRSRCSTGDMHQSVQQFYRKVELVCSALPPLDPTVLHVFDIDAALSTLVEGNVAFVPPDSAKIEKSQIVEARLSVTKTPSALITELIGSGKKESASLRVGDKMAATLSGGGAFDISPSGPQAQLISHKDTIIWTWTITPKQTGSQFFNFNFRCHSYH